MKNIEILSLHAMNRLVRGETAYTASKTSMDDSNRALFLSVKIKS